MKVSILFNILGTTADNLTAQIEFTRIYDIDTGPCARSDWSKPMFYLRKRKHVPCFYRVVEARVEVWEYDLSRLFFIFAARILTAHNLRRHLHALVLTRIENVADLPYSELYQLKNGFSSPTSTGTPSFFTIHYNHLIKSFV